MELKDIREKIDQIDDKIAKLYAERMECVKDVIDAKKQSGKAVFDPDREKNIILRVTEQVDED
ncbi:MAG: chorismate mutase, partial [Clostridia bacterium]|nr:chorismate mutase [Clostridia bacterium]